MASFWGCSREQIRPASFEKFFESLALGDGASISILHRDGTLLARYPHVHAMIGLNFKNAPVHQRILSKSDHGTTRIVSAIDGLSRLASARALTDFPIDIIATTTVSAALADWREQLSYMVAAAGLSVLVIAGMLFFVVRKLVAATSDGKAAPRHRRQQYSARPGRLRQGGADLPFATSAMSRCSGCRRRWPSQAAPCSDLIAHRKETGSFDGDVDEFCNAIMRNVALGKATRQVTEAPGGRAIQITNQPLETGGWVATHRRCHGA